MFGIAIYDNFLDLNKNFIVPMPNKAINTFCGLHAVLMCGYDDELEAFLCANSWGREFGKSGLFYLKYDYVLNPDFAMDFLDDT